MAVLQLVISVALTYSTNITKQLIENSKQDSSILLFIIQVKNTIGSCIHSNTSKYLFYIKLEVTNLDKSKFVAQ